MRARRRQRRTGETPLSRACFSLPRREPLQQQQQQTLLFAVVVVAAVELKPCGPETVAYTKKGWSRQMEKKKRKKKKTAI